MAILRSRGVMSDSLPRHPCRLSSCAARRGNVAKLFNHRITIRNDSRARGQLAVIADSTSGNRGRFLLAKNGLHVLRRKELRHRHGVGQHSKKTAALLPIVAQSLRSEEG